MIGIGAIGSVGVLTQSSKSIAPPLSVFPGAALALSVARRLRDDYTGPALRVRRSTDNAELDVGFTQEGRLDEAALSAFVASGNGFVTTLYDNSGNGRHAWQPTAANQPQIVVAGGIIKENGFPVAAFNGTNSFMEFQSALGVFRNVPLAQAFIVERWAEATEDASLCYTFHFSANTANRSDTRFSHGRSAGLSVPRIIGRQQDATTSSSRASTEPVSTALEAWQMYMDYAGARQIAIARGQGAFTAGSIVDPAGNTSNTDSLIARLGAGSNGAGSATSFWNGSIAELILFNSGAEYLSRSQGIAANQLGYFGV